MRVKTVELAMPKLLFASDRGNTALKNKGHFSQARIKPALTSLPSAVVSKFHTICADTIWNSRDRRTSGKQLLSFKARVGRQIGAIPAASLPCI